jgi:hypothetical protein
LLFDLTRTILVSQIELKGVVETVGALALIALLADWRLAALDDPVALIVGHSTKMSTIMTSFTRSH